MKWRKRKEPLRAIARNGIPIGNPRIYVYFYYPEIDIMESVFSTIFLFFILKKNIVQWFNTEKFSKIKKTVWTIFEVF